MGVQGHSNFLFQSSLNLTFHPNPGSTILLCIALILRIYTASAATPALSFLDVSFGSANRTADDVLTYDTSPDYVSGHSNALVQAQGTPVQIQLHVDIQPVTASGTIELTAVGGGMTFYTNQWVISGGGPNNQSVFTLVSYNSNLPTGVQILNLPLTYYYRVLPPDGSGNWATLGSSNNKFFLTWNYPTASATRIRSVLKIACQNAGATTEAQTVSSFWTTIAAKTLKDYNGDALVYYPPNSEFGESATTLAGLLV